jgi:tetratricopeptide (TPR) repeat protein
MALKRVAQPAEYHNALVDLIAARALVEAGWRSFHEAKEHEPAYRLARLYARLAVPPAGVIAVGEAAEAWARALRDEARRPGAGEAGRRAEEASRQRFKEAGEAFAAVADALAKQADEARWLWRSTDAYWQGQEVRRAVAVLERFVQMIAPPEQIGEAWYRIAQARRDARDEEGRDKAYQKCLEYTGPAAYEARYELALLQADQGKVESAKEALQQNLKELQGQPEVPAYERSLYALGELLYRNREYLLASTRLQQALEKNPANQQAVSARLHLAESYRQLGLQEFQNLSTSVTQSDQARAHHRSEYRRWLEWAAAEYQKIQDGLGPRGAAGPLSPAGERLLVQARFCLAECRANLEQYLEAVKLYQDLALQYKGRVEEVLALRGQFFCYAELKQADYAREVLHLAGTLLEQLSEEAFRGRPDHESRQSLRQRVKEEQALLSALLPPPNEPDRR